MDARLVWDTWRRLLTNDQLVEWVMYPESRAGNPNGLNPDEVAILADYGSTPAPTDSNIGMYRRGLVRNALGALDQVPLTRRLLYESGLDIEAVAMEFARSVGYADNGPNFWRTAGDFVAYLGNIAEFASLARQDVLAIDAATIALARRLGKTAPGMWPDGAAAAFSGAGARVHQEADRFVAHRAAVVVSSSCDLTAWIENPFGFDPGEQLERSPRHWLIYFPAAEAAHEYAELSERSARAFDLLWSPKTAAELSLAMDGLAYQDVLAVIDSLAELGVVVREANSLSLMPQTARFPSASREQSADNLDLASRRAPA
jgi:hypothetical protein